MKPLFAAIPLCLLFLLTGCRDDNSVAPIVSKPPAPRDVMEERFPLRAIRVLKDEQGRTYYVERHWGGGNYGIYDYYVLTPYDAETLK